MKFFAFMTVIMFGFSAYAKRLTFNCEALEGIDQAILQINYKNGERFAKVHLSVNDVVVKDCPRLDIEDVDPSSAEDFAITAKCGKGSNNFLVLIQERGKIVMTLPLAGNQILNEVYSTYSCQ